MDSRIILGVVAVLIYAGLLIWWVRIVYRHVLRNWTARSAKKERHEEGIEQFRHEHLRLIQHWEKKNGRTNTIR